MSEAQHDRLRAIRIEAGYGTAQAAAAAIGVKESTYGHHENGTAGLSRSGDRYARFFKVSLEWLLTGRGEKRPSDGERRESEVLELFREAKPEIKQIIETILKGASTSSALKEREVPEPSTPARPMRPNRRRR